MPRVKIARKSTAIDMTAMCDVAFLLLTFFILSAKPKVPDPLKAEIPASTSPSVIPETDFSTLEIAQGKVFFNVEGADVRKKTLEIMGQKYGITFTGDEMNEFAGIESFGVDVHVLKQFLAIPQQQRGSYTQSGIPVDTTANNQLFDWVHSARVANKYLHDKELKIGIKGDGKEEYPVVEDVIATLQKQSVNRFNLITSLKAAK
jgi:biopolymer transport protein ExbD